MKTNPAALKLAKLLSYAIALILVLLPFHAIITTWAGSNFGHLDLLRIWKELFITLLVFPAAWLAFSDPKLKKWLLGSWVTRLYILYIALHLALGVWALVQHQVNKTAFIYALIVNLRFLGFFLVCAVAAAYSDFLYRNWRKILLAPAGIVIVFGLIQKFLLPYDFLKHFGYGAKTIPAYQTVDANLDYRRIQSTLRGANPLGAYLVLVIPALISMQWRKKLLYGAASLAGLTVMFFTYSRSAWLGLVISLGLIGWLMFYKPKHKPWLISALLVILLACGASLYTQGHNQAFEKTLFHSSSSSTSSTSSNAVRLSDLENGAKDIVHQPLGGGPGTAGPASFRNAPHPARIAENYYLQLGQETGIAGMAIFIVINIIVGYQLWQRRQSTLAAILLVSLTGISLINMLSHAWTDDTLSLLWWGLAGIALAPILTNAPSKPAPRQSREPR